MPRSALWLAWSRFLRTMFSSSTPSGKSVIAPVPEPLPCVAGPMWVLLAFAMIRSVGSFRCPGRMGGSRAAVNKRAAAAEAAGASGSVPIVGPRAAVVIPVPVNRPAPTEVTAASLVLAALVDAQPRAAPVQRRPPAKCPTTAPPSPYLRQPPGRAVRRTRSGSQRERRGRDEYDLAHQIESPVVPGNGATGG